MFSIPDGHGLQVLVVGNSGVGKTSIIKRYAHNLFSDKYAPTIGVDFALKALTTGIGENESVVRLQLWDIAGQEQFGAMTRVYYKGAVGAFVVFDLSVKDDGISIQGWKKDIDEKVRLSNGDNIPVVLLANKCDIKDWSWTAEVRVELDWHTCCCGCDSTNTKCQRVLLTNASLINWTFRSIRSCRIKIERDMQFTVVFHLLVQCVKL